MVGEVKLNFIQRWFIQRSLNKQKDKLSKHRKEVLKRLKMIESKDKRSKEQIYLKSLNDLERIVAWCKEKGWTTKADWVKNNLPIREMAADMVKKANEFQKSKEMDWQNEIIENRKGAL